MLDVWRRKLFAASFPQKIRCSQPSLRIPDLSFGVASREDTNDKASRLGRRGNLYLIWRRLKMVMELPVIDRLKKLALSAIEVFPDQIINERDISQSLDYCSPFESRPYEETHLALLLTVLHHWNASDEKLLQSAEARLHLWDDLNVAPTFFNAMAVCLTRIEMDRSNLHHPTLDARLKSILKRYTRATSMGWNFNCGNNMYLQQLLVDRVLIPIATGRPISDDTMADVARGFIQFQTSEGFFFDLPRNGHPDRRILPLTYNLKILFLLGLCHIVRPYTEIEYMLRHGLKSTLPFFSGDGTMSYLGRTDNTTFAAGLASFCLHLAIELDIEPTHTRFLTQRNRDHWLSFDVRDDGCLEVNRYGPSSSRQARVWSADDYAFPWQYAIAGAAYAALGYRLLPQRLDTDVDVDSQAEKMSIYSDDLGLVKICEDRCKLYLRTRSDFHANDQRYLGPTILRLEHDNRLLIGAIPKTYSGDPKVWKIENPGHLKNLLKKMVYRYQEGWPELNAITTAFIPALTCGSTLWLPCSAIVVVNKEASVRSEHLFRTFRARGIAAVWLEVRDLLALNLPSLFSAPGVGVPPQGINSSEVRLDRIVEYCDDVGIRITDSLSGNLCGKMLRIATRSPIPLDYQLSKLALETKYIGWGSDGPQEISVYAARLTSSKFSYHIDIPFSSS